MGYSPRGHKEPDTTERLSRASTLVYPTGLQVLHEPQSRAWENREGWGGFLGEGALHFHICQHFASMLSHSVVSDSATPWTIARQAPLSISYIGGQVPYH